MTRVNVTLMNAGLSLRYTCRYLRDVPRYFLILCLAFVVASPTSAKDALPQVTIEAQRQALEHRVNEFVRKVTNNPAYYDESLPLWHDPLCFAVAGLPTTEGLFALGRLADITRAAGLRVGHPGCKYNFIVVFTDEPNKLLRRTFRLHPKEFDAQGGMQKIRQFLEPSKPQAVRAWHNVRAFSRNGVPVNVNGACLSVVVQQQEIPVSCQFFPSRIERYDVYAFSLALVVVDTTYPRQLKLGQLIDYVSMVGLADIAVGADLGNAPSILQLFDQSLETQPSGLTPWDETFLSALYHSDQGTMTQRSQIAVKMFHDISP